VSATTHAKTTLYVLSLSGTTKIYFPVFCAPLKSLPWHFSLNLWKLAHIKFSSAILSNNFSTSLESIILGHENDEKIWILLLMVQWCTGWLGVMRHVVSPTDMLQSIIITHPSFQLPPDSSSSILLLYGKFYSSFAKCNLITFSSLKSLSVAASVKNSDVLE